MKIPHAINRAYIRNSSISERGANLISAFAAVSSGVLIGAVVSGGSPLVIAFGASAGALWVPFVYEGYRQANNEQMREFYEKNIIDESRYYSRVQPFWVNIGTPASDI